MTNFFSCRIMKFLAVPLLLSPVLVFADLTFVTDARTGCKIVSNGKLSPNGIVEWSGKCVDGKAEGPGTYRELLNGEEYYRQDYSEAHGVIMKQGMTTAQLDGKNLQFIIEECKSGQSFRRVKVDVPPEVNTSSTIVFMQILSRAQELAWKNCPITQQGKPILDNIMVNVMQNGKKVGWARCYDTVRYDKVRSGQSVTEWRELDNSARSAKMNAARTIIATNEKRMGIAAEESKRKTQAEQAQIKKKAADQKAQALADKYGAKKWVPWDKVRANPYPYEGQRMLAYDVSFTRMLSSDTALFDQNKIVVGVPKTAFQEAGTAYVLAVAMLAPEEEKNQKMFGTTMLRMKYLGHESCVEGGCKDFDGELKN